MYLDVYKVALQAAINGRFIMNSSKNKDCFTNFERFLTINENVALDLDDEAPIYPATTDPRSSDQRRMGRRHNGVMTSILSCLFLCYQPNFRLHLSRKCRLEPIRHSEQAKIQPQNA